MRDYAKVAPTFWTGRAGREIRHLGRDAQARDPHDLPTGGGPIRRLSVRLLLRLAVTKTTARPGGSA